MVATAGPGWVLAPALKLLVEQLDDYDASRDRVADGSIGDARHQAENYSDHNPRPGPDGRWYVTAVDITNAPWLDAWVLDQLTADGRVKYLIRNRRYWQRTRWSMADAVKEWVPYGGSNPHDHHVHISVQIGSVNDLHRWAMPDGGSPQEDDMTPDQAKKLDDVWRWMQAVGQSGAHTEQIAGGIAGRQVTADAADAARDAALAQAVAQLAARPAGETGPLDMAAIRQAAEEGAADALARLQLSVSPDA
jgi:hypothetical protein